MDLWKIDLFCDVFFGFILVFSCIITAIFLSQKKGLTIYDSFRLGFGDKNGIIFGKIFGKIFAYSPTRAEGHCLVLGGSGSGKSSCLLIPTLRSWDGTALVIDISGDLHTNVKMPNQLIFEPENGFSTPFNVFFQVDSMPDIVAKNQYLEQFAYLLMPNDPTANDATKFFTNEGRKILTASLICYYHQNFDFVEICRKITDQSWQQLFNDIDKSQNQDAIRYINSFYGASQQNTAGAKQSCDLSLKLFATNESIRQCVRRPHGEEIAFTPDMLETHSIFIVLQDDKLQLFSALVSLIISLCFDYFSTRTAKEPSILFALDEFASFGNIDILDALRKYRKRHIRIMILTQSLADLEINYSHTETMAMLGNFAFIALLHLNDLKSQEFFSSKIGYKTRKTDNGITERRLIVEPADLSRLGNKLILLHQQGHIRLKKNYYFKKTVDFRHIADILAGRL